MLAGAKHVPMLECISIHQIQSLSGEYPINLCLRIWRDVGGAYKINTTAPKIRAFLLL
jgi:hypothetical protein